MDLGALLGAEPAVPLDKFSIYLPDRDKHRSLVANIDEWIEIAMTRLAKINEGATRMAPAGGIWAPADGSGHIVRENTTVVYSFIKNPDAFRSSVNSLAVFLHTFGRDTNQGAVMVEFGGRYEGQYVSRAYYISNYVLAADSDAPT